MRFANQEGEPEIFSTIQGEGRHTGEPAVFARLSGCNLQCTWCDTPYTWNWEGTEYEHDDGVKYDRQAETIQLQIGEAVDNITGHKIDRVVITGGEPLIQQTSIIELIDGLRSENPNYKVEIETNGTITPKPLLIEKVDQFNVSPKMDSSLHIRGATGQQPYGRNQTYRPKVLDKFAEIPHADFKFVVEDEHDLKQVQGIVLTHQIPHERVYLMPQSRTQEQLQSSIRGVAQMAIENGFNLSNRLHVEIWGDERGV